VLNFLFIDYGLKELNVNLKENIITNVIFITDTKELISKEQWLSVPEIFRFQIQGNLCTRIFAFF